MTIDHVGPMARTVHDCALMLETLAGPDVSIHGRMQLQRQPYTTLLEAGGKGLIGILKEGFDSPDGEKGRECAGCWTRRHRFERDRSSVSTVSVKEHTTWRWMLEPGVGGNGAGGARLDGLELERPIIRSSWLSSM